MTEDCGCQSAQRIADLKELLEARIEHQEELTDQRLVGIDKALILQTSETERRLHFLNGEAERLRLMQATYIPREVYESDHKALVSAVDDLKQFRANAVGRQSVLTVVISAVIAAIVAYGARVIH